jgi:cbb3-type cytochrome oxidase maturation protein
MTVLYVILPLALLVAGAAVAAFAWTVRSGQLDDVDTPPRRILFDDDCAAGARSSPPSAARAETGRDLQAHRLHRTET